MTLPAARASTTAAAAFYSRNESALRDEYRVALQAYEASVRITEQMLGAGWEVAHIGPELQAEAVAKARLLAIRRVLDPKPEGAER
jgi:hypothetical protein